MHWVLWNLEPNITGIPEAAKLQMQGRNDFQKIGYGGPCPPPGRPHRYFFKLYALDSQLTLKSGSSKKDIENAMEGHIIARAELVGTYERY